MKYSILIRQSPVYFQQIGKYRPRILAAHDHSLSWARDGVHHVMDLIALSTAQQGLADKSVTEVVDARPRMTSAGKNYVVPASVTVAD
jgi:hypothetical protein